MIHHTLNANAIDSHLGGNIGGSLLDRVDTVGDQTWIVLELSSAMLWWLHEEATNEPGWSPAVAVITNISPNHLDWHGDERHYVMCKEQITRNQLPGDKCLRGDHVSEEPHPFRCPFRGVTIRTTPIWPSWPPRLRPGPRCRQRGPEGWPTLRGSPIGSRRLMPMADSSTTPSRPHLRPLFWRSTRSHPIIPECTLIAGGYDKGVSPWNRSVRSPGRLAGLYTIGTTGPSLAAMAGQDAVQCHDLRTVVENSHVENGAGRPASAESRVRILGPVSQLRAARRGLLQLVLNHLGIVGSS